MKAYYIILITVLLPLLSTARQKDTVNLKGVEVKSKRPLIQQELDKTIVNVSSMISSASSNTLEVLEKTPGVTVGLNGDISLNGRGGVLVLIDGRSTYMSAQDLANYLKTIPGASLDRIELIDNPPARYDAGGNAVINIRLKRNRVGGFTGSLSTGFTQGRYIRGNHSLSLNYNYKKINLFSNVSYSHEKTYSRDDYETFYYDTSRVLLNNHRIDNGKGFNATIGMDFLATKNTTYGVQVNISGNHGTSNFNSDSRNYTYNIEDSISRGYTFSEDRRTNLSTNFNMLHKFGTTGRELSADVNYLRYDGKGNQDLQALRYLKDGSLTSDKDFLYVIPSDMEIYNFKADYVHPFSKKAKFEAGIKSSYSTNDNISDYYQLINGQGIPDNSMSNHFKYRESINAAYVMAQRTFKRWAVQGGLRVEHTTAHGEQLGNADVKGSSFRKDYFQAFPSFVLQYKLDTLNKNSLTFTLGRRMNRPNYRLLNPFVFFRDQYTYTSGNPDLVPQFQYRYELRFQHKQWLRSTLSYNRFSNVIFTTTNVVDKIIITKPQNVSKGYMLLLNTGINLDPARWWNFNTDILLSRIGLNGDSYGQKLNPETFVLRLNIRNQLDFGHGWTGELGGYYASVDLNGQTFTDAMFRVSGGLQKKVLKGKGSVRFNAEDIFHSWVYHNRSVALKNTQYFQITETDTQRFGLAFTYSFGKDTFKRKSKHNDNALDEEKNRM